MKRTSYIILFALLLGAAITGCRKGGTVNNNWGQPPFLSIGSDSYTVDCISGDTGILVKSNIWWNVSISYPDGTTPWINTYPTETKAAIDTIKLTYDPNVFTPDRSAIVTVTSDVNGAAETRTFTITQVGWSADRVFTTPTVTIDNSQQLMVDWNKVDGAKEYRLLLTDSLGTTLQDTTVNMAVLSYDAGAFFLRMASPVYVGKFTATVDALTANPDLSSSSTPVSNHSMFDATSGDGSSSSPYFISNPRHFANISQALAGHYRQTAALDFTGITPVPIGTAAAPFTGFYTGYGNHVTNLAITINDTSTPLWALFGVIGPGSEINGMWFESCSLTVISAGVIAGTGAAIVPNGFSFCVASNCGGTVDNIITNNCQIMLGNPNGDPTKASGATSSTLAQLAYIGMIVGSNITTGAAATGAPTFAATPSTASIQLCQTRGGSISTRNATPTANGAYVAGGIVGVCTSGARVYRCANLGTTMITRGNPSGGIGGDNGTYIHCYNTATIEGCGNAGGIVGRENIVGNDSVAWCYNKGPVGLRYTAANSYCGGVTGTINTAGIVLIMECWNSGTVATLGTDAARPVIFGGVVSRVQGAVAGSTTITNCYNTGYVFATNVNNTTIPVPIATINIQNPTRAISGGILGQIMGTPTISNCYNVGTVTSDPTRQPPLPYVSQIFNVTDAHKPNPAGAIMGSNGGTAPILSNLFFLDGSAPDPSGTFNGIVIYGNAAIATGLAAVMPPTTISQSGKSQADMQNQATFTGWDPAVWSFGGGYPILINNPPQ